MAAEGGHHRRSAPGAREKKEKKKTAYRCARGARSRAPWAPASCAEDPRGPERRRGAGARGELPAIARRALFVFLFIYVVLPHWGCARVVAYRSDYPMLLGVNKKVVHSARLALRDPSLDSLCVGMGGLGP